MKRNSLLFFTVLTCLSAMAQDIIVTNKAERIEALITEVSSTEIRYKKWNYQDGPVFVAQTSDLSAIIYKNGEVQVFGQDQSTENAEKKSSTEAKKSFNYRSLYTAGLYKDWLRFVDYFELIKPFVLSNFGSLYVTPITFGNVETPEEDNVAYKSYQDIMEHIDEYFQASYNRLGVDKYIDIAPYKEECAKENALILNVKLERLEPSNWATRTSSVRITGSVVNAENNEILVKFKQQRLSVRSTEYSNVLREILDEVSGDVANMLIKLNDHY